MPYPNSLVKVHHNLQLYVPVPEQVKPTYNYLLSNNSATIFPYWAKIWASSKAIATFLTTAPNWITGKRVVEIGAGIGLPSFVMAQYAKEIIISDYATDAVALLNKNIQHLQLKHVKAMRIDWNFFPNDLSADTVILSDINYAPDQFNALLLLIKQLLLKGSTIIVATPQRITAVPFIQAIQPYIQHTVLQTVDEINERINISILILSQ